MPEFEQLVRGLSDQLSQLVVEDGAAHFANATPSLDRHQVAEHMHQADNELHGQGTPEGEKWAKRIKDEP